MTGVWVAAKKMPITAPFIVDQQRGLKLGQPGAQDVMGVGAVLFDVVIDQMSIRPRKIVSDNTQRPEDIRKYFQLQGEIKQVILQAILTEADGAVLRILIE